MDSITHISQKILAERARQRPQQRQSPSPETAPPPPYTASDSGDESSDEQEDDEPSSMKLTINAAHFIRGSNNLIPTSPSPLADATKFSTLLLHAVNQINNAAGASPRRNVKVDLTINCGITILGDRNVVGNVGLKPKSPQTAVPGPGVEGGSSAVAGAKRKAEEDAEDQPEQKRSAVDSPQAKEY